VAFVGGSLVQAGGHNPLEPVRFGVPVVMGPSSENFREIVEAMRAAGAIRITGAGELANTLTELLREDCQARTMGQRGREVFEAQAGATARTTNALLGLMGRSAA
jgi:3-deoxy-D-manno-octulosonic-acid transferase